MSDFHCGFNVTTDLALKKHTLRKFSITQSFVCHRIS